MGESGNAIDMKDLTNVSHDLKYLLHMKTEYINIEMADVTTASWHFKGKVRVNLNDGPYLEVRKEHYVHRMQTKLLRCAKLDMKGIGRFFMRSIHYWKGVEENLS